MKLNKYSTYLTAKIINYYYNAYVDAQLAEEVIAYINSKGKNFATKGTITQQRVKKLIKSRSKPSQNFLIGLAYTVYYGNGLANYLYARMLTGLLFSPQKAEISNIIQSYNQRILKTLTTKQLFQGFADRKLVLATYWFHAAFNHYNWIENFARVRCNFTSELDIQELKKAALEVQSQNGKFNRQVADKLLRQSTEPEYKQDEFDPKVKFLRQAAREFEHQKTFLKSGAHTQRSASRWDKVFVFLLGGHD